MEVDTLARRLAAIAPDLLRGLSSTRSPATAAQFAAAGRDLSQRWSTRDEPAQDNITALVLKVPDTRVLDRLAARSPQARDADRIRGSALTYQELVRVMNHARCAAMPRREGERRGQEATRCHRSHGGRDHSVARRSPGSSRPALREMAPSQVARSASVPSQAREVMSGSAGLLESSEVPTTRGTCSGRHWLAHRPAAYASRDLSEAREQLSLRTAEDVLSDVELEEG